MKYINRVKCFWDFLGGKNWYEGVDEPTFYQQFYKWRIGFKTAYKVSKIIWD